MEHSTAASANSFAAISSLFGMTMTWTTTSASSASCAADGMFAEQFQRRQASFILVGEDAYDFVLLETARTCSISRWKVQAKQMSPIWDTGDGFVTTQNFSGIPEMFMVLIPSAVAFR